MPHRALPGSHWFRYGLAAGLGLVLGCGSDGPSAPTTGSLAVAVTGLPSGATAAITLTGPSGFSQGITGNTTVPSLTPGSYTLTADRVMAGDVAYDAESVTQVVTVVASRTALPVAVAYGVHTGTLQLTITGLPDGANAAVTVTGPQGLSRLLTSSSTLTILPPGEYAIAAANAPSGGHTYAAAAPAQTVTVAASATAATATVTYAVSTGAIAVVMSGLPSGATGSAQLTGPDGYQHTVAGAETVTNLRPGTYTVTGSMVTAGVDHYAPTGTPVEVVVAASTTPVPASVSYALSSGSLALALVGLPAGASASVSLSGPGGYHVTLTQSQILAGLTPGAYTIVAASATNGANIYAPAPTQLSVTIQASPTPTPATFTYALASGSIALQVAGLPGGAQAVVDVTGPGGFSRQMTGSGVIQGLTPGSYTVAASSVTVGLTSYAPAPASQTVSVVASTTATTATVTYTAATGSLAVTVSGLPGGVNAAVTVTGPGSYTRTLTGSQTLTALLAGSYTISASPVANGLTTYTPTPLSQNVSVATGAASASVAYAPGGGGLNLIIDGYTLTQTVQTYAGTVPLVGNKDAFLRVFVKASQSNSAAPAVRARFYNGATLLSTVTIPAPGASVPTTVDQSVLGSSWNVTINASLLQPGTSMLLDVDPTNAVAESSESDNTFPSSGSAQALNVTNVSTFQIRLVPVTQSANGLTGNASNANKDQFLSFLQKLYPVSAVDVDVRAAYTTAAPALDAGDANGAWGQILSEINALRSADASTRYYYGVVKVAYSSGIAGLGYVPGRAAIGWDNMPSATSVLTHEVGHNFGRWHAPCGGPSGVDPSYPYPNAQIGVYGYDLSSSALKLPTSTDVMSYCSNTWISDYNYNAIFSYRQANPFVVPAAEPGLLVWGRVVDDRVVLEAAYDVIAPPSLPSQTGRYRLDITGDAGQSLVSLTFDGERVADAVRPEATFAFVIPKSFLRSRDVAQVRVASRTSVGESRESSGTRQPLVRDASDAPQAVRVGAGLVRLSWIGDDIKGIMVRDARTGDVLSFARAGSTLLHTTATSLDLLVSNGVRSQSVRVAVR